MQLTDVFCYTLLMVTMTATWAYSEEQVSDLLTKKLGKRMNRRDSSIIVDSLPAEKSIPRAKTIYRRISKKRHVPPRATYGPPRAKYGTPPRSLKKPGKKFRGNVTPKRPSKLRGPKPQRYDIPAKRQTMKPVYGPPKSNHQRPYYSAEAQGFAEPPAYHAGNKHNTEIRYAHDYQPHKYDDNSFMAKLNHEFESNHNYEHEMSSPASFVNGFPNKHSGLEQSFVDYQNLKQGYGEPPVDSYGAPVKSNLHDLAYPTDQTYPDSPSHIEQEFNGFGSHNPQWQSFKELKPDNSYAYSKKLHAIAKPDREVYITAVPKEADDEQNLKSYSDIFISRQAKEKKKKKASYYDNVKVLNQPWKGSKMQEEVAKQEVIVGGQYAEPPARYIPKFQHSAPMLSGESDFAPLGYSDPANIPSSAISSYVNYKNSNMAFSPQNLNDVFSIVDK